ncbi:hypothetical protein HK096_001746 [Nowakowskiella sp. JEL0078]|nr:hypothetical protein HK096_001746 [Nowakowskiella sp. JEL0078]
MGFKRNAIISKGKMFHVYQREAKSPDPSALPIVFVHGLGKYIDFLDFVLMNLNVLFFFC